MYQVVTRAPIALVGREREKRGEWRDGEAEGQRDRERERKWRKGDTVIKLVRI